MTYSLDAYEVANGETPASSSKFNNGLTYIENALNELLASVAAVGSPGDVWADSGETWTYASADSPTFTLTIAGDKTGKYTAGMRFRLTQSATVKYFIVTKVAYVNPTTTVTVYGGTDYTLANAAVSSPAYSPHKAPQGFPLDPLKWTVESRDTSSRSQASPVAGTWYNPGSLTVTVPIGSWLVGYQAVITAVSSAEEGNDIFSTLSTANNSQTDTDFTAYAASDALVTTADTAVRSKHLALTAKTPYYLNVKTSGTISSIAIRGDLGATVIRAVSAYL